MGIVEDYEHALAPSSAPIPWRLIGGAIAGALVVLAAIAALFLIR